MIGRLALRGGSPTPSRLIGATIPLLLAAAAMAFAAPAAAQGAKSDSVKVETRNIYLGADLPAAIPALLFGTPAESRAAAGELWRDMQDTNFPARANRLAAEIEDSKPHLIGLQEVAFWRRGPLGDKPAREPVYNFLRILRNALEDRGLNYGIAVQQREFDGKLASDLGFNVRLTMRDVILYRKAGRVEVFNPRGANFESQLFFEDFESTRGWTSVEARVRGNRLRFVNTHLEALGEGVRDAQAQELIDGPLSTNRQVILVGDLNSNSDAGPPASNAYDMFIDAGFVDRGVRRSTCCWPDDLLGRNGGLRTRIDHVLTNPPMRGLNNRLLGADPANRTNRGMWPSDHAGVISVVR